MDFLTVKFLGPVVAVGLIAFMRWVNVKASGKPYFPGVGEIGKGDGSGSGGAFPNLDLPKILQGTEGQRTADVSQGQPTDVTPVMTSSDEVQQNSSAPINDQTPVVNTSRQGDTSPLPIFPSPIFTNTPSPTPVYHLSPTPVFTPQPYHPPPTPIQFQPISPTPQTNIPAPMYRSPSGTYAI